MLPRQMGRHRVADPVAPHPRLLAENLPAGLGEGGQVADLHLCGEGCGCVG